MAPRFYKPNGSCPKCARCRAVISPQDKFRERSVWVHYDCSDCRTIWEVLAEVGVEDGTEEWDLGSVIVGLMVQEFDCRDLGYVLRIPQIYVRNTLDKLIEHHFVEEVGVLENPIQLDPNTQYRSVERKLSWAFESDDPSTEILLWILALQGKVQRVVKAPELEAS